MDRDDPCRAAGDMDALAKLAELSDKLQKLVRALKLILMRFGLPVAGCSLGLAAS